MTGIVGLGLLAIAALAAGSALRLDLAGTLLAAYVIGFAEVVLGAEVLSPFHAVGQVGLLAWEGGAAALAVVLWLRAGRWLPSVALPSWAVLRQHPLVLVLGAAVGLGLAFELFLCLAASQNNWDALAYHLSRAAAWYQHGSIGFFPSHTARENTYPGNAEIRILVGMVFTHGDRLAALPQLVAELVLLVGIFGVARRLGFGRAESAFAALLFGTLSEVVLEATTAQNDLVAAAPLLAAAYFLLGRSRRGYLVGAVGIGLALGTKFTAVYALPLLGLLALSLLPWRRVLEFAAAAACALVLVGSAVYAQNVFHYRSPLGAASDTAQFEPALTAGNTLSTTARTLYRFADMSGYGGAGQTAATQLHVGRFLFRTLAIAAQPVSATGSPFLYTVNTAANEDDSYFGPLGALLLLPLALGYLGAFALRRTSRTRLVFALAIPVVAVEVALTYKYNAWLGRFMIMPVAFATVLAARVYAQRLLSAVCAAIGILFLFFALAHNERKPVGLDGTRPIWTLSRGTAEGLVATSGTPTFADLDAIVPRSARIGVLFGDNDWDYPLYGPHLTRHLTLLPKGRPFRAARSQGLDWVVVGGVSLGRRPPWPQAEIGDWTLLARPGTVAAARLAAYERESASL